MRAAEPAQHHTTFLRRRCRCLRGLRANVYGQPRRRYLPSVRNRGLRTLLHLLGHRDVVPIGPLLRASEPQHRCQRRLAVPSVHMRIANRGVQRIGEPLGQRQLHERRPLANQRQPDVHPLDWCAHQRSVWRQFRAGQFFVSSDRREPVTIRDPNPDRPPYLLLLALSGRRFSAGRS